MDLTQDSRFTLCDGNQIPIVGFGTYAPETVPKSLGEEATKVAIDVGYRHIDGAFFYGNNKEIGRAIQEKIADGTVTRPEMFYTGKLWNTHHAPELVRPALERQLQELQLDYMDLCIIHTPISQKSGDDPWSLQWDQHTYDQQDLCATWKALEACKDAGLVRSIGVSNFNRSQLQRILNMPGLKYKPVCNQVECHPYLNQSKFLEFCKSQGVVMEGYSVLGSSRDETWIDTNSPVVLEDQVLANIAQKYQKTTAQVAIRYQLQRGLVALSKSFNPERIKQNFQVFDFCLTPEDMKRIDGLNRPYRYDDMKIYSDHPEYPYHDEY